MRFILFGFLYFATGMAVAQSQDYTREGALLAVGTVLAMMSFMQWSIGAFGGKVE